ncbi:MAG TPA: transglutaminase family protein [Roseiflexaceae bacterium]|nr:transglutaminase family protein [Roseiflexaceae bacterium]
MRLEAGCELTFNMAAPTPMILMLRPRSGYGQWIAREEYQLEPFVPVTEYTDGHGNLCQRVIAPAGRFAIRTSVVSEAADQIDVAPGAPLTLAQDLPDGALQFLLPSRYCESDELGGLAIEIAAGATPGYDQAEAIRAWIHNNVEYRYGTSDSSTSAADTAQARVGVCRDYTHLGMALCRALSIPARMVVGYLYQLEPMDLHAWFEAYVGGRWYAFDATQNTPRGGRIVIAYGRDAADVALTTQFGPATLEDMRVWVNGDKVTR